jgi:hypothetical protein
VGYTHGTIINKDYLMSKVDQQSPNWQPLSQLPLLASMVQGILENTEEQYQTFLEVADKPHVLNDAIVQRAQRLYTTQLDDANLYEAQTKHWQQEKMTTAQQKTVDKILENLTRIRELSRTILRLLSEIEKGTIDRIMAMSDEDLGYHHLRRSQNKTSNRQKQGVNTEVRTNFPSDEHQQLAQTIDNWVMAIHARGAGIEEMLSNMIDQMPAFKRLLDSASPAQIDALCEQYPGFYQFAKLLEDISGGIRDGSIQVPKD